MAVAQGGEIEQVDAERPITIQDLLRHTSGLTYEFRGNGPVHKMYMAARIYSRDQTNADQVTRSASCRCCISRERSGNTAARPMCSADSIEVLSGCRSAHSCSSTFSRRSGMIDTAFHVPAASLQARLAEGFAKDPDTGAGVQLVNVKERAEVRVGRRRLGFHRRRLRALPADAVEFAAGSMACDS